MSQHHSFPSLAQSLLACVQGDLYWDAHVRRVIDDACPESAIHLAIFVEPYLTYVLEGRKTVESRFSQRRFAPYHAVSRGDILLLKRSGGSIVGLCEVSDVWFYQLEEESWQTIRRDFTQALCAQDPQFWLDRSAASYATLMRVQHVRAIEPLDFVKRDRRGWVILQPACTQPELMGVE